jgi:hypothetical protein
MTRGKRERSSTMTVPVRSVNSSPRTIQISMREVSRGEPVPVAKVLSGLVDGEIKPSRSKVAQSIRLAPEFLERLDRIALELSKKASGAELNRSDALRVVLLKGLEIMEGELL